MRKTYFALILLLCALLLSGCQKKTPYETMCAALDKTAALETLSCRYSTSVELQAGDYSEDFAVAGTFARAGTKASPTLRITVETDGATTEMTYADGKLHTDGGEVDLSAGELETLMQTGAAVEPDEQDFISLEQREEDGSTVYYGMVRADAVKALFSDALTATAGLDLTGFTWSDMTVQLAVSDGYVARQTLLYSLTAEKDGVEGTVYVVTEVVMDLPA